MWSSTPPNPQPGRSAGSDSTNPQPGRSTGSAGAQSQTGSTNHQLGRSAGNAGTQSQAGSATPSQEGVQAMQALSPRQARVSVPATVPQVLQQGMVFLPQTMQQVSPGNKG